MMPGMRLTHIDTLPVQKTSRKGSGTASPSPAGGGGGGGGGAALLPFLPLRPNLVALPWARSIRALMLARMKCRWETSRASGLLQRHYGN